jgi:hypothetical protein
MDKRVAVHACVTCRALPVDQQPKKPRLAPYGGPRSKRCKTHELERKRAKKIGSHTAYVTRIYGLTRQEQTELWEYQGRKCPCGRQPTRMPDTDHDHRCCPGPTSCGKCVRMLACRSCNTYLMGRYTSAQLRAVADAMDDPPMMKMRRENG